MDEPATAAALLPLFAPQTAWFVGLVLVFGVLRPVGRMGWAVATTLLVGGFATVVATVAPVAGWTWLEPGPWLALPWLVLAGLLVATAEGSPLRWEPRAGPSSGMALALGAIVLHVGAAWHGRGGALSAAGAGWASGASGVPAEAPGPLSAALVWLVHRPPVIQSQDAVFLLALVAAAALVFGVGRLAGSWGFRGTAWTAMAAAAWLPSTLIAYAVSPGVLFAGAALVWSSVVLGRVYAGRHLPQRLAAGAGALLGLAVGFAVWPLLVLPLWLRRVPGRQTAPFLLSLGGVVAASALLLLPAASGWAELWQQGIVEPVRAAALPGALALLPVALALAAGVRRVALSPTREAAVTGALLILTIPWWPPGWHVAGPVLGLPFVLLAAVAPDRPEERWPPDARGAVIDLNEPVSA